jgi:hypothetical protein
MATTNYIFANAGQLIRLVIQTLDSTGHRVDGYVPVVESIVFPDFSVDENCPIAMTNAYIYGDGYIPGVNGDGYVAGLYTYALQLPTGAAALGTYIANVYWEEEGNPKWETFAINVARPFGSAYASAI